MMEAKSAVLEDRLARFVTDALLAPEQLDQSAVAVADEDVEPAGVVIHAHGDFGHADR